MLATTAPASAAAQYLFTVTTTADSGPGSLRQAISDAVSSSAAKRWIQFHIPTADPGFDGHVFTIQPGSELPVVTHDVIIDGATQTAFTGNTNPSGPEVVLNGAHAGSAAGIHMGGDNNSIKNLVVNGFEAGIVDSWEIDPTPSGNQIVGNYIGTDPSGTAAVPNGDGVEFHGFATPTLQADSNVILNNVISGNNGDAILLCDTSQTKITFNRIGVDRTGANPLPNTGDGIHMVCAGDRNALIRRNVIAYNAGDGITDVPDFRYCATNNCHYGNWITRNSIHDNGQIGINLEGGSPDEVTPNDPGDGDIGANGLQNFPVIASAVTDDTATTVDGTLNTTANGIFKIELYSSSAADPSGYGEGQQLIGGVTVTTDSSGNASFELLVVPTVAAGRFVTATATDNGGNTSEFGAAVKVTGTAPPSLGTE